VVAKTNNNSLIELIAILPIHFVTVVSTSIFLRRVLPDHIVSLALEPVDYSDEENPWIVVRLSRLDWLHTYIHLHSFLVLCGVVLGGINESLTHLALLLFLLFQDLCREVLITTAFTIALLVLPVLFQLNDLPRWSVICLFYPLFNYAVDGTGTASTFSPNVVLALSLLGRRPIPTGFRMVGSLLGGLVGGKLMQLYFPDEPPLPKVGSS
jgi:hypothetical protein